ncbi:RNA polymerase sigma factor SigJ [Pseudoduganella sp. LjRoot289]|uniref:RNA polymerase sigma factor SigJ n=1 Tax=Pseudoduganella sp. LjRoot289 TaxID=3342314 RepID=UPI003ED16A94
MRISPPDQLDGTVQFETQRRYLRALAYRMLGSRAEAEDVVQDCWLRWNKVDLDTVRDARTYLSQTASNLCLDRLQSARQRREQYVGVWLPEPLIDEAPDYCPGPEVATEYAQEVGMAFMLALERLSPLERAAFILHDVFDIDFDEVATRLGRSGDACRQLASRARTHVKRSAVRSQMGVAQRDRLLRAFGWALQRGDIETLSGMLSADAEMLSDGGGIVTAVPKALQGGLRVAKALIGFTRSYSPLQVEVRSAWVNGLPGAIIFDRKTGAAIQALALGVDEQDRVAAVYIVRNPSKLTHLHRSRDGLTPGGGIVTALGNMVLGVYWLLAWSARKFLRARS